MKSDKHFCQSDTDTALTNPFYRHRLRQSKIIILVVLYIPAAENYSPRLYSKILEIKNLKWLNSNSCQQFAESV